MSHIRLQSIEVGYPIFSAGRQQSLASAVAHRASFGVLGKSVSGTWVQALRGVTLEVEEGDRLGIIGRNGSGKSTLLKTLAGVNWPQRGQMSISGRVNAIINLGAGLDPEKSGQQNVEAIGRLFGLDRRERTALLEDVADFSQLGEFMAVPTRAYSAGMVLRLSYGLATALPGDILVVDEVLSAGDAQFQSRAVERTRARFADAKIFVMVTHSGEALLEYCDHCIWLDRGRIVDQGTPHDMWLRYLDGAARGAPKGSIRPAHEGQDYS